MPQIFFFQFLAPMHVRRQKKFAERFISHSLIKLPTFAIFLSDHVVKPWIINYSADIFYMLTLVFFIILWHILATFLFFVDLVKTWTCLNMSQNSHKILLEQVLLFKKKRPKKVPTKNLVGEVGDIWWFFMIANWS